MFRLALAMGIPVARLFDEISPDEFEWWLAFSFIEPFGAIHDERRAMTTAIMAGSYDKKSSIPTLEKMSPFLSDCQDIGTDKDSQKRSFEQKKESTLRMFTSLPGWRKVEKDKE